MNHADSQDTKEQVRQATDIVDLVGDYLPLRRQGRLMVAQCPWHDDSRPSLQVNPERQTWKCWVCNLGGDVFSFVMQHDRCDFREALVTLAERAGIPLAPRIGSSGNSAASDDRRDQLAALDWARREMHRCLLEDPEGAPARAYLAERKLTRESIERFAVGFSPPEWEWLVARARRSGISLAVLERAGVVGQRTVGQGHYDRFRSRVVFPIADPRGRTIAFGGRILPQFADERSAKYVNCPETPLYSKSHQLYALDLARDAIAKSGEVLVMEGYTDVVMAHQFGVGNAVAVCGTALGEGHLRLLRRFTDRVCLVLDGDEAGRRRAAEVLELFLAAGMDLRVITLPQQLDPCEFLLAEGGEAFASHVSGAVDALEHKFRLVLAEADAAPDSAHRQNQAVEQLLATLAKCPQGTSEQRLREEQLLGRIARRFQVGVDALRVRVRDLRRAAPARVSSVASPQEPASDASKTLENLGPIDREVLELVLLDPRLLVPIASAVEEQDLASPAARRLYRLCLDLHRKGRETSLAVLMTADDDPQVKSLLVDIDHAAQAKQDSSRTQRLEDLLATLARRRTDQQLRQQFSALQNSTLDDDQEAQQLKALLDNLKRRQAGSLPTDG